MGLPALQADYLFLGPLIKARLATSLPEVPVDVCETAEQVLAADKRPQVLMVLWAGDVFGDHAGGGRSQKLRQRWLVMLGMNNAGKQADARHSKAGPLLSRVHKALAGWQPEGCATSLTRAAASMRPDINQLKALYPLGFEIELAL